LMLDAGCLMLEHCMLQAAENIEHPVSHSRFI